ncbi:MAG: D-alanyl-D-alanine carboxypeptidase/D-alanyl-D-alanine endopeptidase [Candidatus Kryptoniota bacterium]
MKVRNLLIIMISSALLVSAVHARQYPSVMVLKRNIDYLIRNSRTDRTIKSLSIYSRKWHKTIYSLNSKLLLRPASNLKIVTTSCALHYLGPDYNFRTVVLSNGFIRNHYLDGNLVVLPSGDPVLSLNDIDSIAASVLTSGIDTVSGDIVVCTNAFDSLQWGNGWMWDDEPSAFAMFISPACVNHNAINISVVRDSTLNKLLVLSNPATSFVTIEISALPGLKDSVVVNRIDSCSFNIVKVSGTFTNNFIREDYSFSVRHPAKYFGTLLMEALERRGVIVRGQVLSKRDCPPLSRSLTLATITHNIDTVITYTNKESDNLGAECLLRIVPREIAHEIGSADSGITFVKKFLSTCGVDSTEYFLVDGSGVSHYNLITSEALVKVLDQILNEPSMIREIFINSLPVAGVDGTLEERMKFDSSTHRIVAKTGSISGVSTLSGYVFVPGDTIIFSMMMQNFAGKTKPFRQLQDEICHVLYYFNHNARSFEKALRLHHLGTFMFNKKTHLLKKKNMRYLNRDRQL